MKAGAGLRRAAIEDGLARDQVLAVQLHALDAAVLVDLEPVCHLERSASPDAGIFVRTADVAERDGIDAARGAGERFEAQLQVIPTDHA